MRDKLRKVPKRWCRLCLVALAVVALGIGPAACGGSGGSHTTTTRAPGY